MKHAWCTGINHPMESGENRRFNDQQSTNQSQVAQDEMYEWLQEEDCAKVALFDATNTTKKRRHLLVQRSKVEKNAMLVFIESICDDPIILSQV